MKFNYLFQKGKDFSCLILQTLQSEFCKQTAFCKRTLILLWVLLVIFRGSWSRVATPCLKTPHFPCPRALTAVMDCSLACTLPADQGLVCKCWSLPKVARGAGTQWLHKMASGCFKPGIQSDTQPWHPEMVWNRPFRWVLWSSYRLCKMGAYPSWF